MQSNIKRLTVDLAQYPNLVVIVIGMRVNRLYGIKTILGFHPKYVRAFKEPPDGLLHQDRLMFSLRHQGFRQYWRDYDSMERWARTGEHLEWWRAFLRESGGTGFWHELYCMQGGMEGVYGDLPVHIGFQNFAPVIPAVGDMSNARKRLRIGSEPAPDAVPRSPQIPVADYP